jgi:outer membrane protein assembly factor BamB
MGTKQHGFLFVWFLFLVSVIAHSVYATDWPRWRGPEGNGVSKETEWNPEALRKGPKIAWRVNIGPGYSNVSIQNNRLYTMGAIDRQATVFCLNADTGKIIWKHVSDSFQDPQSTPTIDGEFVYILTKDGLLVCLNEKNGKERWKRNIVEEYQARAPFYGFACSPLINGDLIIITTNVSGIAVNKNTGEKVWGSEKPQKESYNRMGTSTGVDYSTPVIYEQGGKRYAVIASFKGLSAVEVESGTTRWLFDWEKDYDIKVGDQVTDPIVFDNKLFITTYMKYGSFLFEIGGGASQTIWTNANVNSETGSPVLVDGNFYVCQGGIESYYGALRCIDGKTGKMMWEEKLEGNPISITAAGKNLIVLDSKANLYIVEATPAGFNEQSRCQIPDTLIVDKWWTHPVLCNGKIYCRGFSGEIVCIDVR